MARPGLWISRTMWELRRRHVYRVVGAYAISAWFVVQIADVVLPALFAPEWVISVIVLLAILGLPVAIILAWAYDITPSGVVRTAPLEKPFEASERSFRWTGRWLDYVIICGLLGIVVWMFMDSESVLEPDPGNSRSIAVLPFTDLSPDQDSAYFSDGMAEAIMDSLARIPSLQVTARTSSFAYRQTDTDVREVARLLGVGKLLEGSVRRSGDQVRISTRLVDGRSGRNLWSQTYDARLDDVFAVQDSISRAIAGVLEIQLAGGPVVQAPTRDQTAYDHYLKGRALLREEPTRASTDRAIEQFTLALGRDPAFGLAHAGLCTAHWQQYETTRETQHVERALATCERARLQDPLRAETQIALAWIHLGTGRHEQALTTMQAALALDPDNSQGHLGLGLAHERLGDHDLAEEHFLQAIRLDPAWWRNYSYFGGFHFGAGNFAAAAEQFRQAIRLEPSSARSHSNLGAALLLQGEFDGAAEAFREAIERQPAPTAFSNAGTSYFLAGRYEEAEVMFRVATEFSPAEFRYQAFLADALRQQTGREQEAGQLDQKTIDLVRQRLEVNPSDDEARAAMVHALARGGNVEQALTELAELAELGEQQSFTPATHATLAAAWLALEDPAASLAHLEAAVELGWPIVLLAADPRLARLFEDQDQASASPTRVQSQHDRHEDSRH